MEKIFVPLLITKFMLENKILKRSFKFKNYKGQSLLEILVALSLGTVFLGTSLSLLGIIFRSQNNINFNFYSQTLFKEAAEIIIYSSKNHWNSLYNLQRNNNYKIAFSQNIWSFESGQEESSYKNIPYRLYFKIFNVLRDQNGNISSSGDIDSSTLKVTIFLDYGQNYEKSNSISFYITRSYLHQIFTQTDWSGGGGVSGPVLDPSNNFDTSENIDYSTTAGEIKLATTTSSGYLISSILDTGVSNGVNFHSLIWQGNLCSGCQVRIQLASSNSSSGPWNYYGPTSSSDYYTPSPNSIVSLPYSGSASHQNRQYLRYKIELIPNSNQSPIVQSISISYGK